MAVRIQNLPKKSFGQPQFTISCPSWWNSNEQQIPQSLSRNISFKVESPPQVYREVKTLGVQLPDQESSSALSIGHSHNEVSATGGISSQDQCISSESGQDESCGRAGKSKMKPLFMLSAPDIALNPSQADSSHLMARSLYNYPDPCFGGLYTPYGPQSFIQPQLLPQMMGMTAARVPLPLDLANEGPIYVNAKQYHGILRRRQSRAKLEAQNKQVKTRKPYLHESRHRHALNRVRGSGGRFLSAKAAQIPDPALSTGWRCVSDSIIHLHQKDTSEAAASFSSGTGQSCASNITCSDVTSVSESDAIFGHPDRHFSSISARISGQNSGGLVHCTSVVR